MTAKRISRASSNLTDPPMALQGCWEWTDSIYKPVKFSKTSRAFAKADRTQDCCDSEAALLHFVYSTPVAFYQEYEDSLGSHVSYLLSHTKKIGQLIYGLIFTPVRYVHHVAQKAERPRNRCTFPYSVLSTSKQTACNASKHSQVGLMRFAGLD